MSVSAVRFDSEGDFFSEGNAYLRRGAYGAAAYYYRKAIECHGPRDIYYQNLVLTLRFQGDFVACHREVRNGLTHNPTSQALRHLLEELNAEHWVTHQGPKLSIIVPVYNSGQYLESCLLSILQQTFRDFELIVINDGSQDNSGEIIDRLAATDDRVRVIRHETPSGNPGTPRNRALEIARGAYVGFVDSDDWVDPDFYAELMQKAEAEHADIVFSGGFVNHSVTEASIREYNNQGFEDPDSPRYKYHDSFMIWDKVFNARLIQSFDIRLAETRAAVDVPFVFRAYYWAFSIAYCDHTVAYHYRRESDSSVTVNYRKSSDCQFEIQAYELIWAWADEHQVPEYFRDVIRYKQINSYTYTLSVIAPDYFEKFFRTCKATFRKIPREVVLRYSDCLTKNHIVKKYDAVVGKPPRQYAQMFRGDMVFLPDVSVKPDNWDGDCTLFIDGERPGVLVFPDWSRSNPYQRLLYGALAQEYGVRVKGYRSSQFTRDVLEANRGAFSCIHLHWLHALMDFSDDEGADSFFDTLAYARELGYRVVYTAHNIVSHDTDHEQRERAFRTRAAKEFDYLLAHGDYAKERLIEELDVDPSKVFVVPHGSYEGYYPNYVSRSAARRHLSLADDDYVFLFFGNIKGYKGVDVLLEVFDRIRREFDRAKLVIAGRVFEPETAEAIRQHAQAHPGIIFHPGFIDDNDAQYYLKSADLMVLPYRRILTSGAALLSLSFRLPILAPRTGLLPELIEDGKQGYLFDDYAEMARLMRSALSGTEELGVAVGESADYEFDAVTKALRWTEIVRKAPFDSLFSFGRDEIAAIAPSKKNDFAIVRLIGNELMLDYNFDHALEAITFTLQNENSFEGTVKLWVLDRLVDHNRRQQVIELLEANAAEWVEWTLSDLDLAEEPLAFDELPQSDFKFKAEYAAMDASGQLAVDLALWKHKRAQLMSGAGSRNRAIELGAQIARWVLPVNGLCFFSEEGWGSIKKSVNHRSDLTYHVVSVASVECGDELLDTSYQPSPKGEPKILFRDDAPIRFSDDGGQHSPEHALLTRLGVSGYWDKSLSLYPWKKQYFNAQPGTFCYSWSGWLAHLDTGSALSDGNDRVAQQRRELEFVRQCDMRSVFKEFDAQALTLYKLDGNDSAVLSARLAYEADKAVGHPILTVVDKQVLPPSLDAHDYWSVAPFAWPNSESTSGLPYVFRPGQRVPGTDPYDTSTRHYDRASLQRLFDTTTVLAIAGATLGNTNYTGRAYQWIRAWFVDPETAMNPHLVYAKEIKGHYHGVGAPDGVSEAKDFFYLMDAVRLVRQSEFWTEQDERAMNRWCSDYLSWLMASDQGGELTGSSNQHEVAFAIQVYALAAYLGNQNVMYETVLGVVSRLPALSISREGRAALVKDRLLVLFGVLVKNTSRFDLGSSEQWQLSNFIGYPNPGDKGLWSGSEANTDEAVPPLLELTELVG